MKTLMAAILLLCSGCYPALNQAIASSTTARLYRDNAERLYKECVKATCPADQLEERKTELDYWQSEFDRRQARAEQMGRAINSPPLNPVVVVVSP